MLSQEEISRYQRHLSLSNVGVEGQEKLRSAKVLVVGVGGLGCPILKYLTAAGVCTIGLIDYDLVDESNLQRQILFDVNDVGKSKVECAISKLSKQNPFVDYVPFNQKLTKDNVLSVLKDFDIIIDGTDNFSTRYLVGDASLILNKTLVFGSIYKFEGQVSVFNFRNGPSFRCAFPNPPKANEVPNCSDIGVIGILPGVVGTRMAAECIKVILGIGEVLSGKLMLIDILGNQNIIVTIQKNVENFNRTELEESYDLNCEIENEKRDMIITAKQLKEDLDNGVEYQLIDVREDFEYEICAIEKSKLVPMSEITSRYSEIDSDKNTVVICHHGMRSAQVINFLASKGYEYLINLKGGIHSWARDVDTEMTRY